MEKKIPLWVLVLTIFLMTNITVLFGACVLHVYEGGGGLGKLSAPTITIAKFPVLVRDVMVEVFGNKRSPLILDNRFPEIDGFKKNGVVPEGAKQDTGYLLVSSYDGSKQRSTAKLIRISDQKVLNEWAPDIQKMADTQQTKSVFFDLVDMQPSRYRLFHPELLNDGGLVFQNTGPLFKIDKCSNVEWRIDGLFHHSVEKDAEENLWVPSVIEPESYEKFIGGRAKFFGYRDDAIAKISKDGKVLSLLSISKILEDNGYRGVLFGVRNYDPDLIHLNEIRPALYSSKYWEKGDLLLSIASRSTVFIYRPSTNKIIWLRAGPWLYQHNPDFVGESKISIFGNDTQLEEPIDDKISTKMKPAQNNIYIFDLADNTISTPYADILKELQVKTVSQGRLKLIDGGDAFVEETIHGRLLRISPSKVIWEYTDKIDNNTVGMMNWSRYLTQEEAENILPSLEKIECPKISQ